MNLFRTLRASAFAAMAALCAAGAAEAKSPSHIFYIMMENHGFSEIIGNTTDAPYINQIASHYALATHYYGVTHPSLPNYLAAMSGSYQGIWDDCKAGKTIFCAPEEFVPGSGDGTDGDYLRPHQIVSASSTPHWFKGQTLVDQLEAANKTWKAYFQAMPAGGYNVEYAPVINSTTVKLYAQKHNPFLYFASIRNAPERLNNILPFETNFVSDLASGNVPNFVFIAPDQCHDMHGISASTAALIGLPACGFPDSGLDHGAIQLGDTFLQQTVSAIMSSSVWAEGDSAIVITWDEDDYTGFVGCCGSPVGVGDVTLGGSQVPTIVITADGKPLLFNAPSNHYSLLATIEKMWGLNCLAQACKIPASGLLTKMFQ
jgi:hypothetical protein